MCSYCACVCGVSFFTLKVEALSCHCCASASGCCSSSVPLHRLQGAPCGTCCAISVPACQPPLIPRSTAAKPARWPRSRSVPQRWRPPYTQWCLCHPPGPGCRPVSSPGHRTYQESPRGAPGSAAHRRWLWGQSGVQRSHFLTAPKKKGPVTGLLSMYRP